MDLWTRLGKVSWLSHCLIVSFVYHSLVAQDKIILMCRIFYFNVHRDKEHPDFVGSFSQDGRCICRSHISASHNQSTEHKAAEFLSAYFMESWGCPLKVYSYQRRSLFPFLRSTHRVWSNMLSEENWELWLSHAERAMIQAKFDAHEQEIAMHFLRKLKLWLDADDIKWKSMKAHGAGAFPTSTSPDPPVVDSSAGDHQDDIVALLNYIHHACHSKNIEREHFDSVEAKDAMNLLKFDSKPSTHRVAESASPLSITASAATIVPFPEKSRNPQFTSLAGVNHGAISPTHSHQRSTSSHAPSYTADETRV